MFRKQSEPYILQPINALEPDVKNLGTEALERIKLRESANVPEFFIITTFAFDHFVESSELTDKIIKELSNVQPLVEKSAIEASSNIQELILNARIPSTILNPIKQAYENLSETPNRPLIQIIPSNVFDSMYVPDTSFTFEMTQGNFDEIELIVKQGWATLFSSNALELRANQYYQGNLSIALVCQRLVNSEATGTIILSDDNIVIKATYGLYSLDNLIFDKYIVSKSKNEVLKREINPQEVMLVRNRATSYSEKTKEIKLSEEWSKRQKISDDLIKSISQKFKEAIDGNTFSSATWAVEAGIIYFLDFGYEVSYDVADLVKDPSTTKDEKNEFSIKPLAPRVSKITPSKDLKLKEKVNLITKQYIDITNLESDLIESAGVLDGKLFDGTDNILEKGILPEEKFNDKNILEASNYINSSSLRLTTLAKLSNNSPLLYKLSAIGNNEQKLLATDENDYIFDERFIDKPESLIIETMIIKKCRNANNMKNISVLISKTRSRENLSIIKRIMAEKGLRRSNSFKLYAEIAFPSLIYELNNISLDLIDGFVVNVEEVLSLHTYRSIIRNQDWDIFVSILDEIINRKDKNLPLSFYLANSTPEEVLDEIISKNPESIIWKGVPSKQVLEKISEFESQIVTNLTRTGRKIKPLFK